MRRINPILPFTTRNIPPKTTRSVRNSTSSSRRPASSAKLIARLRNLLALKTLWNSVWMMLKFVSPLKTKMRNRSVNNYLPNTSSRRNSLLMRATWPENVLKLSALFIDLMLTVCAISRSTYAVAKTLLPCLSTTSLTTPSPKKSEIPKFIYGCEYPCKNLNCVFS